MDDFVRRNRAGGAHEHQGADGVHRERILRKRDGQIGRCRVGIEIIHALALLAIGRAGERRTKKLDVGISVGKCRRVCIAQIAARRHSQKIGRGVRPLHHADQAISADAAGGDKRSQLTAQLRIMRNRSGKFRELSRKRANHEPIRHHGAAGRDISEIDQQRRLGRSTVNLAANNSEIDQQALFVIDYLGLARLDSDLVSDGKSRSIDDTHAEWERYFRVVVLGIEGIEAENGTGQEVLQLQRGHRLHRDVSRGNINRLRRSVNRIVDGGAYIIQRALGGRRAVWSRSRACRRNDQIDDRLGGIAGD